MKIFILLLISSLSYSKCLVRPVEKVIEETPFIVLATVFNTNFTSARSLAKKNYKDKSLFPSFNLKVDKVLKGNISHKHLKVSKPLLRFNSLMYPNPLYKVRENLQRIFFLRSISEDGVANALTGRCTPYTNENTVKKYLK